VLDFDREAIDRVEAKWPGGGVVLERDGEGWRLLEPLETQADAGAVDDLLSDLKFLRADGFIDEAPPDAEVGLDAPAFEVALVAEASAEGEAPTRTRLAIGATSDGTHRAMRGSVEGALYQLAAERIGDFPRTVAAYRFKNLAEFDASAAVRFELAFPAEAEDEPLVVRGELAEEGWTTSPETMAAGKASQVIEVLASLTAVDIVADAMGDDELRGIGLSPPAVTLRAFSDDEDEQAALLAEVHLGKADPELGIVAQRSGDEVIYRIDFELAERIPISREAFVNRFLSVEETSEPSPEE
jgi:hypothetical protein